MTYYTELPSPVGVLTIACEAGSITGLWLAGQKYFAAGLGDAQRRDDAPGMETAREFLARYFAGEQPDAAALPLRPKGTDFQTRVWQALREIPYGATVTYGDLARRLQTSARAVGAAVGRNPVSILIPCHRVLGANGSLTGYAGGIEAKKFLLELESAQRTGV